MKYEQLPTEYKYDTLADAMYAREVEYFHYDFDRKNFEHLLANATDNEFAANVAERLDSTRKQMGNVEAVVEALKAQIDDADAYAAACIADPQQSLQGLPKRVHGGYVTCGPPSAEIDRELVLASMSPQVRNELLDRYSTTTLFELP
jgi:hypothetical protein